MFDRRSGRSYALDYWQSITSEQVMTAPRRRWFRFSLRTLLVVVTLGAAPMAWVGWQWRIVQARQRLRQEIEHAGGRFEPVSREWLLVQSISFMTLRLPHSPLSPPVDAASRQADLERRYQKRSYLPFPRKWLGDEPIGRIELPFPYSEPHSGPIRAAFPEADVEPFRPERH
jgi:hypothetical protein